MPALVGLLGSGCFLVHQEGGPGPGRTPVVDAGGPTSPTHDAGPPTPVPPPPPLECPEHRADATCLESFAAEAGRPFELPVQFDVCACCAAAECAVEVDPEGETLRLTTTLCPDPCDCDGCNTPTATCSLPALPSGLWSVVVDGAWAFDLPVIVDSGFAPPAPACARYADVDVCGLVPATRRETRPTRPHEICIDESDYGGPTIVRAIHECSSCDQILGPCVAELQVRTDAALPPGGDIHLSTSTYATACLVSCDDACIRVEERCFLPPLDPGAFYRVFEGGALVTSFTAGEGGAVCARPGG